jgi:hypothetical protein
MFDDAELNKFNAHISTFVYSKDNFKVDRLTYRVTISSTY